MTAPFSYGTWRTYGHYDASWSLIQPTQGSYVGNGSDQSAMLLDWNQMDLRVAEAVAAGVEICFPIWGVPVWAGVGNAKPTAKLTLSATSGTITATASASVFTAAHVGKSLSTGVGWGVISSQSGTTASVVVDRQFASTSAPSGTWFIADKGPWSVPGESAVPTKTQFVSDFVAALVGKYNGAGVRKIKYLELWNEPFPTVSPPYWLGNYADLVDMCWAAYSAAKAADPGITVLAPSFYSDSALASFLAAQGNGGKYGHETFDWLNIHQYGQGPNKALNGRDLYYDSALGIAAANRQLTALGLASRPVAGTEWGISEDFDPNVAAFSSLSAGERKLHIQRMIAMAALNGMRLFTIFSYYNPSQGTGLAGDYRNDTTGVMSAVSDVFSKLAGQTIVSGGWRADGTVEVRLATNAVYTW